MEFLNQNRNFIMRKRFSVSGLYKDELFSKRLEKNLSLLNGIIYVRASHMTGNVTVIYNNGILDINYIKKEIYKIKYNVRDFLISNTNKQQSQQYPWHVMTEKQIEKVLNSDINNGLSEFEAKKRIETYGLNQLIKGDKPSIIKLILRQINNYLFKILLIAGGVSFLLGDIADSIVITSIVIIESSLGVFQEYNAEKSLESLRKLTSPKSNALRNRHYISVNSLELVPGDIIKLESGNIVPADGRIINCNEFEVDESCLTGESIPVSKHNLVILKDNMPLAERKNMVYMGTSVTKGNAKIIIVATGMSTEMGKIAFMINSSNNTLSPLQQNLESLGKNLTIAIIVISFGIVLSGILRGKSLIQMLGIGISLAIGAIPEGLSTIVTIALAYGVQRMAMRNAIVRRLNSVETLGSTTVICTDKTGTLTKNEMTVKEIKSLHKSWDVTGSGYNPTGKFFLNDISVNPAMEEDLFTILELGSLCNNSKLISKNGTWAISGDPTEGALVVAAAKAGININEACVRLKEIPFDSSRKAMTVLVNTNIGKMVISKGAPDIILNKCNTYLKDGKINKLGKINKNGILKQNENMSKNALRVLAIAYKHVNDDNIKIDDELTFAGLIGMEDPPRDEVKDAIRECIDSGINVVMITGDQKNTAISIGKNIGLLDHGKSISGNELDNMTDDEIIDVIDDVRVFYRTTPQHKLKIVRAFKKKGYIVAMTGDGVNDAPAVKEANIGIAMGKSGTDVTRDSSDITLADDNFTTIVMAVKEGRGVSENIKKFLRYVLSGNVGEVITLTTAALTGMPMPLTSSQILSINLVTEGIPALALGVEPSNIKLTDNKTNTILDEKLYQYIIKRGSLIGLSTLGIFEYGILYRNLNVAKTLAYSNLVMSQMFNVFDARNSSRIMPITENKFLIPSVAISIATLFATIYLGPFSSIFGTARLSLIDWFLILFTSGFLSRINRVEIDKN